MNFFLLIIAILIILMVILSFFWKDGFIGLIADILECIIEIAIAILTGLND